MDDHAHDGHENHPHAEDADGRVTSPMQDFSAGEAGIGFVVLLVGLAITFGLPLVLA